jgi:hypothetical protein
MFFEVVATDEAAEVAVAIPRAAKFGRNTITF